MLRLEKFFLMNKESDEKTSHAVKGCLKHLEGEALKDGSTIKKSMSFSNLSGFKL